MQIARSDLDGSRLRAPQESDIWVVFHGLRHHVADPDTYGSLFGGSGVVLEREGLAEIALGPELGSGSCLVRATGSAFIYLVFGRPRLARHLVPSLESFDAFGFDMSKVVDVPAIVLDAIPIGREVQSDADRASRSDFA